MKSTASTVAQDMELTVLAPSDSAWQETLSAIPHDVYHTPEYVMIEADRMDAKASAAKISDATGNKTFFIPFLVRACDTNDGLQSKDPRFDVVSPYGYGGYLTNAAAAEDTEFVLHALRVLVDHWYANNICSAFLRLHPILNSAPPSFDPLEYQVSSTPTVSFDLRKSEEELWQGIQSRQRTVIKKSQRLGCSFQMLDYNEYLPTFRHIYEETMNRVSANDSYFFDEKYFLQLKMLGEHLHLVGVRMNEDILSASILFECNGIVQYHLGGSLSEHMNLSPNRQLLYEAALWAKSRGNQHLHLGGGLGGANDNLLRFKSAFSSRRLEYRTLRLVVDSEAYHDLVARRANEASMSHDELLATEYFPAYRHRIGS